MSHLGGVLHRDARELPIRSCIPLRREWGEVFIKLRYVLEADELLHQPNQKIELIELRLSFYPVHCALNSWDH